MPPTLSTRLTTPSGTDKVNVASWFTNSQKEIHGIYFDIAKMTGNKEQY